MMVETGLDEVTAGLLVCLRDACAHLSLEVDCLKSGIEVFETDGMTSTLSDAPEDAHTVARINEIEAVIAAAAAAIRKAERSQRRSAAEYIGFIEDFADARFDAIRGPAPRVPWEELDPVTDLMTVQAYQDDARALVKKEKERWG